MSGYFLLMTNKLAGGTEANVKPGLDRIVQMGPNLLAVIDDSAAQAAILAEGEVWAVSMLSSAAYKLIDDGVPPSSSSHARERQPHRRDIPREERAACSERAEVHQFLHQSGNDRASDRATQDHASQRQGADHARHAKYTVSKADLDKLVHFNENAIIKDRPQWQEAWDKEIAPMTKR